MLEGIDPDNKFKETTSSSKRDNEPILEGIVPVNEFPLSTRYFNDERYFN